MMRVDYSNLLKWSETHFNHLPWRVNRSLYGTLVSEIMLQQTTVGTVINYYDNFLKRYPSINELAKVSEDEMLIAWKGLGYYRRAKNLRKASLVIAKEHGGKIPLNFEKLLQIDGIGEYTASAILAIGANMRALAIDANILRVVSRIHGIDADKKEIAHLFQKGEILTELTDGNARAFNEAFMDLGREVCQAHSVKCENCPVHQFCRTYLTGTPIKKTEPKLKKRIKLDLLRVVVKESGKILAYKKEDGMWLSGQWELPTFALSCEEDNFKQYPMIQFENFKKLKKFKSSITKYDITNYVVLLDSLPKKVAGVKFINLESLSLSTASSKALKLST